MLRKVKRKGERERSKIGMFLGKLLVLFYIRM